MRAGAGTVSPVAWRNLLTSIDRPNTHAAPARPNYRVVPTYLVAVGILLHAIVIDGSSQLDEWMSQVQCRASWSAQLLKDALGILYYWREHARTGRAESFVEREIHDW